MDPTQALAEAQTALHQLMIGRGVVEVTADGYTTKFTKADVEQLKAYIATLQAQIDGRPVKGAINHIWSQA